MLGLVIMITASSSVGIIMVWTVLYDFGYGICPTFTTILFLSLQPNSSTLRNITCYELPLLGPGRLFESFSRFRYSTKKQYTTTCPLWLYVNKVVAVMIQGAVQ